MDYIIGKFYNVPCAKLVNRKGDFQFVPVIGEIHKDPQLGVNSKHLHIDGRFLNPYTENGYTNYIICAEPNDDYTNLGFKFVEIVIARKLCISSNTGINPPRDDRGSKYWIWYESMIGKSCKGKKCPHLGQEMFVKNGFLVCPLHNLHGDLKTEKIIDYENTNY